MRAGLAFAFVVSSGLSVPVVSASAVPAGAYEIQHCYVYCADDRIEVSMWDLQQMTVRRGSDVCQLVRYTGCSDALSFAARNFGGQGKPCGC